MPHRFLCEYSKSNRASCGICRHKIDKNLIRVGVERWDASQGVDRDQVSDSIVGLRWHHLECFHFSKGFSSSSLLGFSELKSTDQAIVASRFEEVSSVISSSSSSSKRKSASFSNNSKRAKLTSVKDFDKERHLELGLSCIEYAKAKKPSPCMVCKGGISNGEPRLGNRQEAWQYEGIMTRWLHLACGLRGAMGGIRRISQLEGFDRIGYDASKEIREVTGELLPEAEEEALRSRMEGLEGLQDVLLASLDKAGMVAALEVNGISPGALAISTNTVDMVTIISDGIAHGLAANCPVCGTASLVECHGRITCWGFINGMTKCVFKAGVDEVSRFRWNLPPTIKHAPWLLEWRSSWSKVDSSAAAPAKKATKVAAAATEVVEIEDDDVAVVTEVVEIEDTEMDAKATAWGAMTVAKLKKELKAKGLSQTGNKKELVGRLVAYAGHSDGEMQDEQGGGGGPEQNTSKPAFNDGMSIVATKPAPSTLSSSSSSSSSLPSSSSSSAATAAVAALPSGGAWAASCAVVEAELPPQTGSAILEVHQGYRQTSDFSRARVLVDDDKTTVYNSNFVEVNLRRGINRFYVVQLLRLAPQHFEVFCHWGKVGVPWYSEVTRYGVKNYNAYPCSSKAQAIELFKQWFLKKGGTPWEQRHAFVPKPEHYGLVDLSRVNANGAAAASSSLSALPSSQPCSLTTEVASLVELLFDEDTILNSMKEANVNVEELPLGSVTSDRILRCSEILSSIRMHLETDLETRDAIWTAQLEHFSADFFTQLPCRDVALIATEAQVAAREEVVNMMLDIAVGQGLLEKAASPSSSSLSSSSSSSPTVSAPLDLHPLDKKAQILGCDLLALQKDSETFKTVKKAFENTAVPAIPNSLAGFKMSSLQKFPEVVEVFEIQRHGEHERFVEGSKFSSLGNVKLLWHGTDCAAGAAIVSGGLRIMPGAGGRLGKGLYFANESAKSGHYLKAAPDGSGLMFLAEVAAGKAYTITADSSETQRLKKAKSGYDSTLALGRSAPPVERDVVFELSGGRAASLATGKPLTHGDPAVMESSFSNDEIVVYDEAQVKLRYCVRVQI